MFNLYGPAILGVGPFFILKRKKMKNILIIGSEFTPGPCEYCGTVTELRPYGKNGAKICFDCGMKPENIAVTNKAIDDFLTGESERPTPEQKN